MRENYCNAHQGGGNVLYCDGHGEFRKYKSLRSRDFALVPGTFDVSADSFYAYDGEF
jgi:prepilin-type processing-associated H-X9-DG protein